MPERTERILRVVCVGLAALLLWQFVRLVINRNPLARINIPTLPSLPVEPDSATNSKIANLIVPSSAEAGKSNSAIFQPLENTNNNSMPVPVSGIETNATNLVVAQAPAGSKTNSGPALDMGTTNANANAKDLQNQPQITSNAIATQVSSNKGTNSSPLVKVEKFETNSIQPPFQPGFGMNPFPGQRPERQPSLPPVIQARVDRIVQSELLAPVIRPMPMALLGIAGNDALMRAPNGQTGLLREGGELGGIKLLRIGTNRVLIEQAGEKKELMIFAGLGGESLLPKPEKQTNEIVPSPRK